MFREISTQDFNCNPFKMIGKDWMLITAEKEGIANTMTAAWGGFGNMWNKDVAYIVIRPQRYTKEFVDSADRFSLTFFDDSYKKQLGYLGKVSGRDENKIEKSGFTLAHCGATPYFEEGNVVVICKKLYMQSFESDCFTDKELDEKCYPEKDYHYMYVGEIEKILVK